MNPGEDKAEFSLSSEFFKKLNQQIVQKDNLIKLLQLQIKNLKNQLEDGAGEGPKKAELAKALEAKEAQTKELEVELTSQKDQLASALREKDEQIQALNKAIEEHQKAAAVKEPSPLEDPRIPELQADLSRLEQELASERKKTEAVEGTLAEEKERAAIAMGQIQSNLDAVAPAAQELKTLRDKVASLEADIALRGTRETAITDEIAALQKKLSGRDTDLISKTSELASQESQNAELKARLEVAETAAKEASVVSASSADLTKRISELEVDSAALKGLLAEKEEQISALQSASGTQEIDGGLVAELTATKAELETLHAQVAENGPARIAELETSLSEESARANSLEERIQVLETEGLVMSETAMKLTMLESEREQLVREIQSYKTTRDAAIEETEKLKAQLTSARTAETNDFKAALASRDAEIARLKVNLENQGKHSEADAILKEEVDQLTGQVADQLLAIQKFEQVMRQTQEEVINRDEEIALLKKKLGEPSIPATAVSFSPDSEILTHFIDFFDGLDSFLIQNPIPELQTLHKQFLDRLIIPNQIEYMPVISEEFSPQRHVATDYFRSDYFADKTIVFEVEKGYRRGDSVVKKSKVWVVQNLFNCPNCNSVQSNPDSRFCHLCGTKIVAPNGLPVDSLPTFEPTPTTFLRFADRMIEMRCYDKAGKYLRDGLALDGDFVPILVRLADVHGYASEYGAAIEVLKKAVSLKPDARLLERIRALEVKNTIFKQAKSLNLPPGEFEKLVKLIQE
ncbi:MAG: hypothetical protein WA705_13315 [Candidatus Ozemobacteraceae bacterium]